MTMPAPADPRAADPYAVLGLAPSAGPEEIKQAYFALVRAHLPERDPQAFKQIRAAYERLRTPEKKLETDMLRPEPWPEPARSPPAPLDPGVAGEDVIRAARAVSDLGRTDWREDFREVSL